MGIVVILNCSKKSPTYRVLALEPILSFGTPIPPAALCYREGDNESESATRRSSKANHKSRMTAFLIDTRRLEMYVSSCNFNESVRSNRHSQGPFPFCTITTKLAKVLYSLRSPICYSHRRTRVPPLGLRALAPARPTWGESLPLLCCHGELCVSTGSQSSPET
jgi:hypothetical protein